MSCKIARIGACLVALSASTALGGASMSFSAADPATDSVDQYNFLDDAAIPGGSAPGGGAYNQQAYTDNGGPPGQTFTTPAGGVGYMLNAISVKSVGDAGGGVFDAPNTFALRISSVSGTTLTPLATVVDIPTLVGQSTSEVGWVTFTLSGADAVTLAPNAQYAFDVYSSAGWFGIDATQGDGAYAGGTAFNSASAGRTFADATLGDLAARGYDRTFHVDLQAVPEPAAAALALCGLAALHVLRRRRSLVD